ncbi:MAG: hypothetical protein ACC651_11750 [Candidatus Scalindua sp.]
MNFKNIKLPINRLPENTKSENFDVDIKGLMARRSAKMPILGQSVKGDRGLLMGGLHCRRNEIDYLWWNIGA